MSAVYDVVVIGAGPGGIAAAVVASEAGLRVCLLDDNVTPGGQIWRGFESGSVELSPHGSKFVEWTNRLRCSTCEVLTGWRAIDRPGPNVLRCECDHEIRDISFRRLILATGARERFVPFPGWTLPGVTGVGGLQSLVKSGLDIRGKGVVVAGTGPLLLAVAAGLANAGARILGIYEQTPIPRLVRFGFTLLRHPDKLAEGSRYRRKLSGVRFQTGTWVVCANGTTRIERVTLTNKRIEWTHECDFLACGFHLVPNLELPHLLGCRIADHYVSVDSFQQTSVSGIACIGELTGIGGLEKALVEGQIAGWVAAGRETEARKLAPRLRTMQRFARGLDRTFQLRSELRGIPAPGTVICRCEDVAYEELKGCRSWREGKLHTRCGMGACQGRVCGPATEFLFDWKQTGVRPPIFPSPVRHVIAKAAASEDL